MTSHQDIAARLRDKSDHYLPDWARAAMDEAADLLEAQAKALSETEESTQRLQCALMFWMPGVDIRLDPATQELAAEDSYLLAGYTGELDRPCWGDGILARALAAEALLAEARKVIEPFANATVVDAGHVIGLERQWFTAARSFLNAREKT